jgi:hypothetical protein
VGTIVRLRYATRPLVHPRERAHHLDGIPSETGLSTRHLLRVTLGANRATVASLARLMSRDPVRLLLVVPAAALLLAACGTGAATTDPQPCQPAGPVPTPSCRPSQPVRHLPAPTASPSATVVAVAAASPRPTACTVRVFYANNSAASLAIDASLTRLVDGSGVYRPAALVRTNVVVAPGTRCRWTGRSPSTPGRRSPPSVIGPAGALLLVPVKFRVGRATPTPTT